VVTIASWVRGISTRYPCTEMLSDSSYHCRKKRHAISQSHWLSRASSQYPNDHLHSPERLAKSIHETVVEDWLSIALPETNIAPENRPLEKEIPIGNHHF